MSKVRNNLECAIAIMRSACDDAEKQAVRENAAAVKEVLGTFAYAMYLATFSINGAITEMEYEYDIIRLDESQAKSAGPFVNLRDSPNSLLDC